MINYVKARHCKNYPTLKTERLRRIETKLFEIKSKLFETLKHTFVYLKEVWKLKMDRFKVNNNKKK